MKRTAARCVALASSLVSSVKVRRIRRSTIIAMAVAWLCSQFALGQDPDTRQPAALFENQAAWNAVYELVRPKDDNELSVWKYESSVQSVFDTALEDSAALRSQRPIGRMLMQRAAWYAFDSLASELNYHDAANQSLRLRLAKVIAASALTTDEIKQLPNTYVAKAIDDDKKRNPAFDLDLPADLLQQDGQWLQISYANIQRIGLTHERSRRGRSEFLLFVRFPGGREQAEEYLKVHNDVAALESRRRGAILNFLIHRNEAIPPSPIFPAGVQAVLLERMLAISDQGVPTATPVTKSVAFLNSKPTVNSANGNLHPVRSAAFELSMEALLEKDSTAYLRRLSDMEPFNGEDRFPNGLQSCVTCHSGRGLLSLNGGVAGMEFPPSRGVDIVPNGTASATAIWKTRRHDFGLLRGMLEVLKEPK